ncbi:thioredoxin-like protein [Vararia minispora EC-137]|uniref:Thioredoxin-like protein n=1 Tax=Vararia minispora EC-137 TaxID=1314806 RepID=A0ACB8QY60_9AGAM|nr:thioredoxin-like protein [Vararia minispora EC-137]
MLVTYHQPSSTQTDPRVNLLTSHLLNPAPSTSQPDPDDTDDESLFAELEAELENEDRALREHGIKQLRSEMERVNRMKEDMHGKYSELANEKEVIRISANELRCIIHFYHPNFRRCEIMDKHLAALAPKYFGTRFLRVFVENVPFLVEKLGIKVLPCVMSFIKGVSKDRIIGFEELGNSDKFSTATLELRLQQSGVIQKDMHYIPTVQHVTTTVSLGGRLRSTRNDDEEDFDL